MNHTFGHDFKTDAWHPGLRFTSGAVEVAR